MSDQIADAIQRLDAAEAAEAAARLEREIYREIIVRLAEAEVRAIAEMLHVPEAYVVYVLGSPRRS